MLIATFSLASGWGGKKITAKGNRILLEGHGQISPADVVEYDRQGQLIWASADTRASFFGQAPNRFAAPVGQTQKTGGCASGCAFYLAVGILVILALAALIAIGGALWPIILALGFILLVGWAIVTVAKGGRR